MGTLTTQATVLDVTNEFNQSGAGPIFNLFQVGGITSGQIYDKITEANALLQAQVALGSSTPTDAALTEGIKRFEVNFASARLAMDLIGVNTTDGFNYNVAGVAVQRANPQIQAAKDFIDRHIVVAKWWLQMLNNPFYVYNSQYFEGTNVYGTPVTYWSTQRSQY